jgi:hypothetical protein
MRRKVFSFFFFFFFDRMTRRKAPGVAFHHQFHVTSESLPTAQRGVEKKMKRWEGKRSCNQKWKLKEDDGRQRNKWQDRRNADLAKNIK